MLLFSFDELTLSRDMIWALDSFHSATALFILHSLHSLPLQFWIITNKQFCSGSLQIPLPLIIQSVSHSSIGIFFASLSSVQIPLDSSPFLVSIQAPPDPVGGSFFGFNVSFNSLASFFNLKCMAMFLCKFVRSNA